MLDKSLCLLGVSSLLCWFYSIFDGKILLANNVDPNQRPNYVASDLDLNCLPMTLLPVFQNKPRLKGICSGEATMLLSLFVFSFPWGADS